MPEPGPPPPALPEGGWMREHAETIMQPEPPVPAGGPPSVLETMQMQSDTGVAQAEARLGRAASGLAAPAGGMPDGFLIDPQRAEAAVVKLEQLVVDLRRAQWTWRRASTFPAPGADEVSTNLATNAQVMSDRADAFATAYIGQIEETALALRAQVDAYRRVEQSNAARRL